MIVDVLLPPTEAYDRGRKFENYKKLESLAREYLLVDSDDMHANLFTWQLDGRWIHSSTEKSAHSR